LCLLLLCALKHHPNGWFAMQLDLMLVQPKFAGAAGSGV
jgi:hypothetical protein